MSGINESETLTKHIWCESKYKFDGRTFNSNQNWNNDKCWCECENWWFSKSFKSYLGKGAVCNCVNNVIEENKYCTGIMKKQFNKELVRTKKIVKILRTLLNVELMMMIMLKAM